MLPSRKATTGGERADRRIVEELSRRGRPVGVFYLEEAGGPFRLRWLRSLAASLRLILQIREAPRALLILEDQGISAFLWPFHCYLWLRGGPPLVMLTHHLVFKVWGGPIRRRLRRSVEAFALRHADLVIAVSESTKQDLLALGISGERIVVIPMAVEEARPMVRGQPEDTLRLVAVGTVEPRKGFEYLIRAVATLQGEWQLDIVGALEPGHHAYLVELARRLGVEGRVTFRGWLEDEALASLLAAADIFVSPSLLEGFGLGVLEALQLGLPVVATRVGAAEEMIEDGWSGMLLPPKEVGALAAALQRLARDPALRERLGQQAAASICGRYSWKRTMQEIEAALERFEA